MHGWEKEALAAKPTIAAIDSKLEFGAKQVLP